MRIVHLLPEMDEGGVERHVLWLSDAQAKVGHDVLVVSAGGKLAQSLERRPGDENFRGPRCLTLPVHRKNPFVGAQCATKLASLVRREGWDILHAHSRVPAWIAWWTSRLAGVPWVVTCHALYSRNAGLYPYRKADGAICVSETVREWMRPFLPRDSIVIPNGLPAPKARWKKRDAARDAAVRFCFIGRLTQVKGVEDIVEAFLRLPDHAWELDVVGDGPLGETLRALAGEAGLGRRIRFHGVREDTESFYLGCDCFLFPSRSEGAGLTLMTALAMGVPVLASDIAAVREMGLEEPFLIPPGDVDAWAKALREAVSGARPIPSAGCVWPTPEEAAQRTTAFYGRCIA